jgi:hypothetical protein
MQLSGDKFRVCSHIPVKESKTKKIPRVLNLLKLHQNLKLKLQCKNKLSKDSQQLQKTQEAGLVHPRRNKTSLVNIFA